MLNLLSILVLIHFAVRLAAPEKPYLYWVLGVAVGIGNWMFLHHAYENSLPQIIEQISTGIWADNFVLVVSLDVLLGMLLFIRAIKKHNGAILKHNWLEYIPSLLLLPVLYYLNANFFYAFPQFSYTTTAILIFLLVSIGLPLLGYVFRWMLNDSLAILEFRALLNIAIFIAVLIAPLLEIKKPAYQASLNLEALGAVLLVCVIGFISGISIPKIKKSFLKK